MLARIFNQFGFAIARLVTAAFALVAVAWLASAMPVIASQAAVSEIAAHILAGETYKPETMEALTSAINQDKGERGRGSYLNRIAVIRLRNVENAAKAGGQAATSDAMAALRRAADQSLASSPDDSFMWMVRFWAEDKTRGLTPAQLNLLRMSYTTGAREGWIAAKRSGLALAVFSQLPPDLAEQVMTEFAGLVAAGFYNEASDILVGPGWATRKQLLARLANLQERDRRQFARVLYNKDVEDAVVPGIEPPPPRPFR